MSKNYCSYTIYHGMKINRLTAINYVYTKIYGKSNYHYYWKFKCNCGNELIIDKNSVLKELTQSCGCYHKEKSSENMSEINSRNSISIEVQAFGRLFNVYTHNARKRNLDFSLSKEQFKEIINKNCYYCNIIPKQKARDKKQKGYILYNGIDRIENNRGYFLDNCIPCCGICNRMKMGMSFKDFITHIRNINNNIHGK